MNFEYQQSNSGISITLINTKLSDLLNTAFPGAVKVLPMSKTPEDFALKVSGSRPLHKVLVYLKDQPPSHFLSRVSSIPSSAAAEGSDTRYYVLVPADAPDDFFAKAQCAAIALPNCSFYPTTSVVNFIRGLAEEATDGRERRDANVCPGGLKRERERPEVMVDEAFSMCVEAFMGLEDAGLEREEVEKMLRDYGSLADLVGAGYLSFLREGLSPDKAKYLNDLFRK